MQFLQAQQMVGHIFRRAREKTGDDIEAAAKKIDIKPELLSKIEVGTKNYNLNALILIAKYYELKGTIEALLKELGIDNHQFSPCNIYKYVIHSGEISVKGLPVGIIGEIDPEMFSKFQIKTPIIVCDIDLPDLLKFATKSKKYTPLPKYPPIIEDLSFTVPPQTFIGPIIEEIKKTDELIKSLELIDSFQNTKTFRITYQSSKGNLTDHNIKKIREKIISRLSVKFQALVKGAS